MTSGRAAPPGSCAPSAVRRAHGPRHGSRAPVDSPAAGVRGYAHGVTRSFAGMLWLTSGYYKIQGRAAEIALATGGDIAGAEHLFIGMLHEGSWPVSVAAGLIDPRRAEDAILSLMREPDYSPPAREPGPHHPADAEFWGARTAQEMGDSHIGVEHAFLEIIRDRGTVPARALAGLASLDDVEAAVLSVKNAPRSAPATAAFLPEGQELDEDLRVAIFRHLPEGATFGFNWLDGRPWINVTAPGDSREVLTAALESLGRA